MVCCCRLLVMPVPRGARSERSYLLCHADGDQPRIGQPGEPQRRAIDSRHGARERADARQVPPGPREHQDIAVHQEAVAEEPECPPGLHRESGGLEDRKSTRLNSSHLGISYAVFCLKKKKTHNRHHWREQIKLEILRAKVDGIANTRLDTAQRDIFKQCDTSYDITHPAELSPEPHAIS